MVTVIMSWGEKKTTQTTKTNTKHNKLAKRTVAFMHNVQVYSASQGLSKSRDPFKSYKLFIIRKNSKRISETKVGEKREFDP